MTDDIDVDNPTDEDFFKAETFMYRMYKYVDADRLDVNRVRTLLSSTKAMQVLLSSISMEECSCESP